MCAYNRYEGEACCGSEFLLQDILRDQWEFNGYVVSDCGAVRDISEYHEVTGTDVEAAALAVKSGTDLNCGSKYKKLAQAVEKGYLTEKEIDMALKRLFLARIKLGMFDPPGMVPYAQIPIEVNDAPEHDNMALESARKSMVLLKNNGILPLKKDKLEKIAVIGPNADAVEVLLGNYNGTPSAPVTPLQGIKEAVGEHVEVIYEVGCNRAGDRMVLRQVPETFLSTNGQPGLQAEYFDNPELQGEPFHAQVDKTIQSNWDLTEIKGLNEEVFSIRWTGTLSVPKSGTYILGLTGDDGFRLYLNEVLLVEEWEKQAPETHTNEVELQAGKEYKLSIEFFQNGGGAMLEFKYAMKTENPYEMAIEAAKGSDAVLFFGGLSPYIEGEEMDVDLPGFRGGDRTEIDVPATQTELLKELKQANENLVAVFLSGSALAMNWEQENIPAILQAWYPGQRGGTALADVLFGKYNPAGRLPVTYYKSAKDLPPFADYSMKNRTYKYFTGEPLYPFGFGLSYTSFEYTDMALEKTNFTKGEKVVLEVTIKNNGSMDGDEVVQLYLTDTKASFTPPKAALKRFTRIHLKAGEEKTLKFELPGEEFFGINEYGEKTFEPGQFMLTVGGSSPGKRSADLGAPEALTAKITIE
jgi:beta-glucosidase